MHIDGITDLRLRPAASGVTPKSSLGMLAFILLLTAVTVATYANSLGNGFVWDDHQILEIYGGNGQLPAISQVFSSADTVFPDDPVPYFRPMHRYILQLELHFFGLHPLPFHAVSSLLHTFNVLLFFRLALLLLGSNFPALVAALLFAVHPVNSEGVNFITSRQNMWAFFFTLSAALTYLRAWQEPRLWRYLVAGLLFFGGLCCKETALMPLIFLAIATPLATAPAPGSKRRTLLSFVPFLLALGGYAALRLAAIPSAPGLSGAPVRAALLERLSYNLYTLPKYAFNLALPVKLSAYYPVPGSYPFGDLTILTGWLLLAAFLCYLVRQHSILPWLALLWFIINYLPISNLIPIPSAPMADRYLYLPAAGIWLVAGAMADQLQHRLGNKLVMPAVVALLTVVLGLLSIQRSQVWKDDIVLFTSIITAEPLASTAGYNLGKALFEAGRVAEARQAWEKTIRIEPGHSKALNSLGNLALLENNLPLAEQYYLRSLQQDRFNAEAHYNLALIYEREGRFAETRRELQLFMNRVPPEYANLIPAVRMKIDKLP